MTEPVANRPRCPGSPQFFMSGGGGRGSFVVLAQVRSKKEVNQKMFREFSQSSERDPEGYRLVWPLLIP